MYWSLRWTAQKPYIFCHSKQSRISKEMNYFRWWASSVMIFDDAGSSIMLCSARKQKFATLRLFKGYDFFLKCWQRLIADAQYSGRYKLKFVGILMTHPARRHSMIITLRLFSVLVCNITAILSLFTQMPTTIYSGRTIKRKIQIEICLDFDDALWMTTVVLILQNSG